MTTKPHPIQPTVLDEHGVLRFKQNKIVRYLVDFADHHGGGLNKIACMDFSVEDREQLAMLIGYSVSGFGGLSYVRSDTYGAAGAMSEGLNEQEARIKALTDTLEYVRNGIRDAAAALFDVHPDDLKKP